MSANAKRWSELAIAPLFSLLSGSPMIGKSNGLYIGPERPTMSIQHYGAGHRVRVSAFSLSGPPTTGEFEILRRYPVESGEPMYRLRDIREPHERMVPENELIRSAPAPSPAETVPESTRSI
jgi:hypothetical protein